MKTKKQLLVASICLVFSCLLHATDYYVDASYTGSNSDGSLAAPWKSLSDVNTIMWRFVPGDVVHFKRGETFSGWLNLYQSGNSASPLTFTTYGTASQPPIFQYVLQSGQTSTDRKIIAVSSAHDVVIDGIKLLDNTMSETDHSIVANVAFGVFIYKSNNITLKNLDISRVGIGIIVQGNNNLITNNQIYNLREIVNTDYNNYDDYGAEGIYIQGANDGSSYTEGSYNKVYNNYIHDCWAPSHDYTYDGGAIEFSGPMTGNEVLYNKATNNEGWLQVNAGSGGVSNNNLLGYNLLINNGRIVWFNFNGWYNGPVTLQVQNLKFYNNDVIETELHFSKYPYLIGCDVTPAPAGVLDLRNNILYINTSVNLTYHATRPFATGQTHDNNLYYLSSGIIGYSTNTSEKQLTSTEAGGLFTSMSDSNPELWNYTLASSSVAVDFGQDVGITKDFINNGVPSGIAPDAGILELQQSVLPLAFTSFYGVAKEGGIDLFWKCEDEWEASHFEVQKSMDGHVYRTIGKVARQVGKSSVVYLFQDAEQFTNTAYYRIKATNEGNGVYSKVIFFTVKKVNTSISVFPNPVSSQLNIVFNSSLQNASVLVSNGRGEIVRAQITSNNTHQCEIDFGGLSSGIYFIKVVQGGKVVCQRTVVK